MDSAQKSRMKKILFTQRPVVSHTKKKNTSSSICSLLYTMSNICRQFLIFSPSLILASPLTFCRTANSFPTYLTHASIVVFAVFTQNHHSYCSKLSRQLVVGQNTKTLCNFHLTSTFFQLLSIFTLFHSSGAFGFIMKHQRRGWSSKLMCWRLTRRPFVETAVVIILKIFAKYLNEK